MPGLSDETMIAIGICERLRDRLSEADIKRINDLNKRTPDACASEQFCNRDELTREVLNTFSFQKLSGSSESVISAWQLARNAGFDADNLRPANAAKLATIKREFVNQYESDLTYVVVEHNENTAVIRPLNFPNKQPITVPWEHLHIFDELTQ